MNINLLGNELFRFILYKLYGTLLLRLHLCIGALK